MPKIWREGGGGGGGEKSGVRTSVITRYYSLQKMLLSIKSLGGVICNVKIPAISNQNIYRNLPTRNFVNKVIPVQ